MAGYRLDKTRWGGTHSFDELLTDIRARAREFEQQNYVSLDIVQQISRNGHLPPFVPKHYGGDERSPLEFLLAIEAISEADGSGGWVASFGVCESYLGGLPLETLEEIWRCPDDIFAGAMFPLQPLAAP